MKSLHCSHQLSCSSWAKLKEPDTTGVRRRIALRRVDRELSKGNYKTALSLIKHIKNPLLPGFGSAKQVHSRRISLLDDLGYGGVEVASLESLRDSILNSIKSSAEFRLPPHEVSLAEKPEMETLVYGGRTHNALSLYHQTCMHHEAGHFLVGYLVGVLPKRFIVSNIDALSWQDQLPGGNVEFLGFDFLGELDYVGDSKGKVSSTILNKFLCVILAGLAAEHLVFGCAHGFHSDMDMMERVFKWMGLTESEADYRVKWAATHTTLILLSHQKARSRLAEAIGLGKSVGGCIDVIESTLIDEGIIN